jgi:cell division transport system permease protein
MWRALRYAIDEAAASLWRGRQSGVLSTATIALALFVLGGFLLVTANLQRLGDEWGRAAEMSVYLTDAVTPSERHAIEIVLDSGSTVASHDFVSKSDALARFKQTFGDLGSTVDGLGENPLPASIGVRLQPGAAAMSGVETLAGRLRTMPGVADVRYDRQWLTRLQSAIGVIRGIGLILAGLLTIAAALTVANVVRLALHARRDEVEIMQLVGAPSAYVRGPFVVEGVLQGGVGAVVALVALGAAFFVLRRPYLVPLASMVNLSSVQFLPVELCLLLVLGGMGVGCLGGWIAARVTQS